MYLLVLELSSRISYKMFSTKNVEMRFETCGGLFSSVGESTTMRNVTRKFQIVSWGNPFGVKNIVPILHLRCRRKTGVWEKKVERARTKLFFCHYIFLGEHNTVHMLYYVYGVEFISSFAGGRKNTKI